MGNRCLIFSRIRLGMPGTLFADLSRVVIEGSRGFGKRVERGKMTVLGLILPCDYAKHYTHGIAVEILSVCLSVCLSVRLSVRLSNACIVTKRKHLAKKVQL